MSDVNDMPPRLVNDGQDVGSFAAVTVSADVLAGLMQLPPGIRIKSITQDSECAVVAGDRYLIVLEGDGLFKLKAGCRIPEIRPSVYYAQIPDHMRCINFVDWKFAIPGYDSLANRPAESLDQSSKVP